MQALVNSSRISDFAVKSVPRQGSRLSLGLKVTYIGKVCTICRSMCFITINSSSEKVIKLISFWWSIGL